MSTFSSEALDGMYNQIKDLELRALLGGLTVLVKDTADYINANGLDDDASETFRQSYLDLLNYDRFYWTKFGPELYAPLTATGLPSNFAWRAAVGEFDLSPLRELPDTESLRAAGWHFLKDFTIRIRDDLLRDTDLETLQAASGQTEVQARPFAALVINITRTSRFSAGFWYPLMLYVVVLLRKTNFVTLN